MFCFFVISVSGKFFVSIFTTDEFYEAWKYIPVLVLGVVFSSISGFAGSNFSATRESKYFFYSSIWGAVSAVLFNFIFIPKFGTMGAAISIPLSFAVMAITRIIYGWKYVKIQNIKVYLLMLLIGVSTIIILLYMQEILMKSLLIAILFLFFLVLNYSLKDDVIKLYQKIKSKKII
jgi:O-antigen/teichoic acid export membrane protein